MGLCHRFSRACRWQGGRGHKESEREAEKGSERDVGKLAKKNAPDDEGAALSETDGSAELDGIGGYEDTVLVAAGRRPAHAARAARAGGAGHEGVHVGLRDFPITDVVLSLDGFSEDCLGCGAKFTGAPRRGHSEGCRARIELALLDPDPAHTPLLRCDVPMSGGDVG